MQINKIVQNEKIGGIIGEWGEIQKTSKILVGNGIPSLSSVWNLYSVDSRNDNS